LAALTARARVVLDGAHAELADLRTLLAGDDAPFSGAGRSDDEDDIAAANRTPGVGSAQAGVLFK
jgi:hypothetical protein